MTRIRELLQIAPHDISAGEIAEQVGISRSTARDIRPLQATTRPVGEATRRALKRPAEPMAR
jgi:response regulator of citrate/malate metabolism